MSEEEYNYLKNNPVKATMIDKFGYIHLYNKNYELHKIASSQFIYKIIDELSKKEMKEEIIKALQQENTQLKQMVNSPSITFTTCPECGKNYSINYCREVYNLQQQLKYKDEKISKVIEYCNEKLKWNRNDGNDYWAGKNNAEQQVSSDILEILESNKED